MSLQLYVGHSGQTIPIDTTRVTSLDALRSSVAQGASIQPARQVFLTSKGKSVRPQTLLTENELYVFDSSLLSGDPARNSSVLVVVPALADHGSPPDTITNQTDLQSWQALFRDRADWATNLRSTCAALSRSARKSSQERDVIRRGLSVAVASLQVHTRGAEQKQAAAEAWADEVLREQERRMKSWEADLALLARIPAKTEFARLLQSTDVAPPSSTGDTDRTLQSCLDTAQVRTSAKATQNTMQSLASRVADIRNMVNGAEEQSGGLVDAVEQMQTRSSTEGSMESSKLLEEIDVILRKIASDKDHVQALPRNSQSVSQTSKMALLHTRNYLPNLQEYAAEMNDLVQHAVQQRNCTAETSMQYMQTLARIESQLSKAYAEIKSLDMPQEEQQAFNTMNVVSRLPHAYGSLLIEAVRRQEWIDKMRNDSSTLAEEIANYQEEEERRRKKWLNTIDDVIRPEVIRSKALGIEVNLQAEEDSWPVAMRQDVQSHIEVLKRLNVHQDIIDDLVNAVRLLDQPTKKQIKHAKAFKNGSMHEAAFGPTSLMLRGEDEHRVLRDANSKLEEELRGQKSRVRKLEDLLHRQPSMSRAASNDVFMPNVDLLSVPEAPPPPHSQIRTPHDFQRQTSTRSRRTSSLVTAEEKRLAQRLVSLEADLQSAQERNSSLERELRTKSEAHEHGRLQVDEAISTKQDIMENMEAQQREFAVERRNLEQELSSARTKNEEFEDELDRLLGSRDNEKSVLGARTRTLETELESLRNESSKEFDEMQRRWAQEQEQRKSLEEQLSVALDAKDRVEMKVQDMQAVIDAREQEEREFANTLTTAHLHLAQGVEPPGKYTTLVAALESLARQSSDHVRELSDAVDMARADNESLSRQHQTGSDQLEEVQQKHAEAATDLASLRAQLASETAKAASLSERSESEREQLRMLRLKFADGETGADALRQRVAEEEARVGKLSQELAEARSSMKVTGDEVVSLRREIDSAQASARITAERLDKRSGRSRDVSQRLFAQNSRLLRLLETLGFAVSNRETQMVVERASKVGASTVLIDPQTSDNAITSASSPPTSRKPSDSIDPALSSHIHWSDGPTPEEEETRYSAYIQHITRFSTDVFSEAISKRIRDFEYTARKWQKEAKSYKERSHRLQTEAHAKIAVRDFKEGDLALFLPTKGKAVGAWAAFNINAPHHFLAEREGMALGRREWLVARIGRVEERVVDLSRSIAVAASENGRNSVASSRDNVSLNGVDGDSNPFDLSDGLTWYLVHATEDKAAGSGVGNGAPTTPGLGKSTVSASNVDARGSVRVKKGARGEDASRTLNKSLDSRRSSTNSRISAKGVVGMPVPVVGREGGVVSGTVGLAGTEGVSKQSVATDVQQQPPTPSATILPVPSPVSARAQETEGDLGQDNQPLPPFESRPDTLANQHASQAYRAQPHTPTKAAEQPGKDQRPSHLERNGTASPSPLRSAAAVQTSRSQSPSKSVRSLAPHLDLSSSTRNAPHPPIPRSLSASAVRREGGGQRRQAARGREDAKGDGGQRLGYDGHYDDDYYDDDDEDRYDAGAGRRNDGGREDKGRGGEAEAGAERGWKSLWALDYEIESPSRSGSAR